MSEIMRPWTAADAPFLMSASADNPDLIEQVGPLATPADAERLLDQWVTQEERGGGWVWAIEVDGHAVGCVGVTWVNLTHRTGWCWYWLIAEARGRGLATRSLATAASSAFERGLYRLELGHRTNNPASCAVARRAGFAVEGRQRAKLEYDGVRYDTESHARLADDPEPEPAIELLPIVARQ